jgi:hypothetical protein
VVAKWFFRVERWIAWRRLLSDDADDMTTNISLQCRVTEVTKQSLRRAAARALREATYLAMLVLNHVRSLAPMPTSKLQGLQDSVAELRASGRNLSQIACVVNEGRCRDQTPLADAVTPIPACAKLRDFVKALIKANLISWESGRRPL